MKFALFSCLALLGAVPAEAAPASLADIVSRYDIRSRPLVDADRFCVVNAPTESEVKITAVFFNTKFSECQRVSEHEKDGFRHSVYETRDESSPKEWPACYAVFHDSFVKLVPKDAKSVPADASNYKTVNGIDYDLMIDANGHIVPRWECGDLKTN